VISMRRGASRHVLLTLPLSDSMSFVPGRRDRALLDNGQVARAAGTAIDGARPKLRGCLSPVKPPMSSLNIQLILHPDGHVQGMKPLGEHSASGDWFPCLRRTFRTLKTPEFPADYAVMEVALLP